MIADAIDGASRGLHFQSAPPDVWVAHPAGVRFGLRVTELARLAALDIPEDMDRGDLDVVLREVLEIDGSAFVDADPSPAPLVRRGWRKIALIEAAEEQLAEQIHPSVLTMDRVLALDDIGLHADAETLASQHVNTVVEVAELLHDAGVAQGPAHADVVRLLQIAGQLTLLEDLEDLAAPSERADDAVEHMLREVLTPPAPSVYLDGTEAEPTPLADEEARLAWRTLRRIRAVERSVTAADLAKNERQFGGLVDAQLQRVGRELANRVLEVSLERLEGGESLDDPEPLLAEVIHCLLASRTALAGSLDEAVRRDSDGRTGNSGAQ